MELRIYPKEQMKHYLIIDVISLVFLIFSVLESESVLGLPARLVLLAFFLFSFYIALWHRDGRLLLAVLGGVAILTVFGVLLTPTILLFGFIFADLLGRATSHWHRGIGIAAIGAMFLTVFFINLNAEYSWEHFTLLPIMILQMVFPLLIYIREKNLQLNDELQVVNHQLEQQNIEEQERHRIARDLHDTLGQTLTMIKLKSELSAKWIDHDTEQAKKELMDILSSSRIALKQVRELVSEMKFISLEKEVEQVRSILSQAGVEATIEEEEKPPLLSSVEETMLSLSLREAVTNVIKHSKATHCLIRLSMVNNAYAIQVADNGIGLQNVKSGMGMQSMKERMQALLGTATVEDGETGGTVVSLILPISHHERRVNE
ncbi:sensor histidine kinase [Sporosarcina sp. ACRSL]|uniref:sensor histidine kinase n=1 Tax=Sporosarcina sp. ACRSL TaxID=2918215 RepID=UPI001EF5ADD5|nr:sensor histidine kinase [Sporosarcina sp. ACRSL]MCG7345974.1 sensor histidine kinase [Sporosarcina sp. ACRSL]